ncbi:MAG: cobalamin-dependent protein [Phycisphaerales bacterium]|nr:cobalamin-dependent protein [Phycisphaerales bacterium]
MKKLKIALISPKGPLYRKKGGIFGRSLRYKPLTLPTLAALLPSEIDIKLTCIDEGIEDVDPNLDADLIGMTVITGCAPRSYELAAMFRRRNITVVLGGPHITLVPDEAQSHADAIVVGSAEEEWPRLVRDFVQGKLLSRYVQSPNLDLAGSPRPDRSVLPRRAYLTDDVFEATRGCVHDCDFCVVPATSGRRPFQRPVGEVFDDIISHGSKTAIFVDPNLIADRTYAMSLFKAITPLKIQWYGLATTLLCQDIPLLDACAASGCRGLLMGFESLSSKNLDQSRKGFNRPEEYETVVGRLHDRRIALQACFVFGMDEDDLGIFERTAKTVIDLKIDLPRFSIATPFPGTALFARLEREGRILTRNWEFYDGQHAVFRPKNMSPRELELGTESAWKHAYSLRGMARRMWHSAASWHVALVTNLGYRHYAHNLKRFYTCDLPAFTPNWSRFDDRSSVIASSELVQPSIRMSSTAGNSR